MKLVEALAIILAIDMMFFLGQAAILNINPDAPTSIFTKSDSLIKSFDIGDNYTLNEDVVSELPSSINTVSTSGGNIFTDTWNAVKNWFLESTGIKFLLDIVNALPNFIKACGAPIEVSFAIGAFWHILTLFLVISYLKGDG
jgi:hypothetical protein